METKQWPNSKQIISTSYEETLAELTVKFKTGIYAYQNVPVIKWEALRKADSIGKFINTDIKPHYSVIKISQYDANDKSRDKTSTNRI